MLAEQARASGKAEAIIDKMVEGRLRKYYEEVVLLEQVFVMTARAGCAAIAAEGQARELLGFARFALGEGIDEAQPPAEAFACRGPACRPPACACSACRLRGGPGL